LKLSPGNPILNAKPVTAFGSNTILSGLIGAQSPDIMRFGKRTWTSTYAEKSTVLSICKDGLTFACAVSIVLTCQMYNFDDRCDSVYQDGLSNTIYKDLYIACAQKYLSDGKTCLLKLAEFKTKYGARIEIMMVAKIFLNSIFPNQDNMFSQGQMNALEKFRNVML
jgi:hypothetical protein